jgi:hypothetical protein
MSAAGRKSVQELHIGGPVRHTTWASQPAGVRCHAVTWPARQAPQVAAELHVSLPVLRRRLADLSLGEQAHIEDRIAAIERAA